MLRRHRRTLLKIDRNAKVKKNYLAKIPPGDQESLSLEIHNAQVQGEFHTKRD